MFHDFMTRSAIMLHATDSTNAVCARSTALNMHDDMKMSVHKSLGNCTNQIQNYNNTDVV